MTPDRLAEVLAIIRWQPDTLAAVIDQPAQRVTEWLEGRRVMPSRLGSWLEALAFTHESAALMMPTLSRAETDTQKSPPQEHIPVYSYHLLRRLGEAPVELHSLYGTEDEAAVFFLVSRGLATRIETMLVISDAGQRMGHVLT